MGFPGGASGKGPPTNGGDAQDAGSISGLGQSPGGRHGNTLQYSLHTHVCSLVATLQDGPVDAGDQPRAQDTADEKPGEAGTQAQQHVVEEQKVVEVVERSPAKGSRQRGSTLQYEKVARQVGSGALPDLWSNPISPTS